MSKLDDDPTQSLWIEKKYTRDINEALGKYREGMIEIATSGKPLDEIRAELDKYKETALYEFVRPVIEKYKKMSVKQGRKFAKQRLKTHAKR